MRCGLFRSDKQSSKRSIEIFPLVKTDALVDTLETNEESESLFSVKTAFVNDPAWRQIMYSKTSTGLKNVQINLRTDVGGK